MSYSKWIKSGFLLFSASAFAQSPPQNNLTQLNLPQGNMALSTAMLGDRQAISGTEAMLGKKIEILNAISQAEDGSLSVTGRVSSEEIQNATQAIRQRHAQLRESSFKKVFITSGSFGRSKKGITLAGKSTVEEIVQNIDRLIEEAKAAATVAAVAPVAEVKVEEKKIEEVAPVRTRFYRDEEDERKSAEEDRLAEKAAREKKAEEEVIVLETFSVTDTKQEALNIAPMAQDMTLQIMRNQEISSGVVATDLDVDSDPRNLNYKVVNAPENTESFSFDNRSGLFSLKAAKGYTGEISFSYVAMDSSSESNMAKVKVSVVKPPKPAPSRISQVNDLDLSKERQVDLLFIVDSSGSMESIQRNLLDSFENFMAKFASKKLDVNIAVLTTNGPEFDKKSRKDLPYGAFIGSKMRLKDSDKVYSERFLKKDSPSIGAQFTSMAMVGTSGDGSETALLPLAAALSDENLAGINSGFLRKDALLSIIIISDEDESRNTYGFMMGKDSYVINDAPSKDGSASVLDQRIAKVEERLKALKNGESGRYRMYSVTDEKGKGFAKASEKFKGANFSLSKDFSGDLMKIAEEVSSIASRSFALKDSTIKDSIVVRINGQEVSEVRDQATGNGFSYDETTHSLKLHGTALKDSVGGKVQIKFDYLVEAKEES